MKIKDWTVMKEKNNEEHHYFYGPLEEYEPEEYENLSIVSYEDWNAEDFSEILGNILEDRNHTWMTDIPRMLIDIISENGFSESQKNIIIKSFAEKLEEEKF